MERLARILDAVVKNRCRRDFGGRDVSIKGGIVRDE
jgi:hypothetical protein